MQRFSLATLLVLAATVPAGAQSWVPWHQPSLLDQSDGRRRAAAAKPTAPAARLAGPKRKGAPLQAAAASAAPAAALPLGTPASAPAGLTADPDAEDGPPQPQEPIVVSGGPRPDIAPRLPTQVSYTSGQAPGTIVIDSAARRLYLVQSATRALSYPVSVGREGFSWNGSEKISRISNWPDWHPPAEMREREPHLPHKMLGGIKNPLGAKALYLGNTLYRIHGTSDARSVGRAASSGCFRMHNAHVVDLASRVGVGTRVVVKNAPFASTAAAAARAPARPQ